MKDTNKYTKDDVLNFVKEYSLYERIIIRLHKRLFIKFYHKSRIEIVNKILE